MEGAVYMEISGQCRVPRRNSVAGFFSEKATVPSIQMMSFGILELYSFLKMDDFGFCGRKQTENITFQSVYSCKYMIIYIYI